MNNILSCLWLLLLMMITACSDEGREMAEIHQSADEMELTIRTEISGMNNNARSAITDAVNTIVALAFDESDALIKTVDAVLTKVEDSTSGTLKIKVPKRTRSIHFLGNYTKETVSGITTIDELKAFTTNDMTTMHYWGMTNFDGTTANLPVILYRNMARVTLNLGINLTGYIAGFVNYNSIGAVVPSNYSVGDTPTIPTEVAIKTHQADNSLGLEHYLFEHANVEDTNPLFVIVEILDKYYKVAFATKVNDVLTYFPIVRNRAYNITINSVDESLGGTYDEAITADPINDVVIEEKTVGIIAVPSATTLNYAESSVEDLLVNVTIPKEVTRLKFTSSDFTIKATSGELVAVENVENSYTITHDENATETTVPVRIRLNDGVSSATASFAFSGTSNDDNVNVQGDTESITLSAGGDEYVRWQGNVPLNGNELAAIVPLKYEWFHDGNDFIPAGFKLKLEFNVTGGNSSWLEVFEIQGETEDQWTNHEFDELNNDNRYVATENGNNVSLSLTLTNDIFATIKEYFRSYFLGEDKIAMAIRGKGITLTKVSILPPENLPTVAITATPYVTSLNYSTNSVSDLIVNVTIPAGVTTLNFSSDYFEVEFINSTSITDNGNGSYTVTGGAQISADARLRLKTKTATQNAGFTFSGTGESLTVTPATVSNISLQANGDENVRWQGDVELSYNNDARKIVLPYSWFSSVPAGSVLRVEYDILSTDGPIIQFSEVEGEKWDDSGYHFPELDTNTDNGMIGCNLSTNKSATGNWIYGTKENSFTGEASFDLTLSQDVLDNMAAHRRLELFGGEDIVIAIQGQNVKLKKISVIPAEDDDVIDVVLDFYTETEGANGGTGQYTNNNLVFGETNFYLKATIPDNVPAGKEIILNRTVTGVNGIHQYYSYNPDKSGGINYSYDSDVISFTTVADKTEYWICWTYVRSDNTQTGNVNVSYSLTSSDESLYTLSGETSANITITGNHPQQIKVAVNGGESSGRVDTSLEYTKNATDQLSVTVTVPNGVNELTIEPGDFDVSWTDANGNTTSGTSFTFATGVTTQDFTLTLKEASKVVKDNSIVTFRYAPNRFVAAGVVAVDLTEKVVTEETIFNYNFDDNNPIGGWGGVTTNVVYDEDKKSNVLQVKRGSDGDVGQLGIGGGNYSGSYSVSMKLKTSASVGTITLVLQDSSDNQYIWRANNSYQINAMTPNSWDNTITWDVTISESADQFVIRLENVDAGTVFYIDDLKLVKNN